MSSVQLKLYERERHQTGVSFFRYALWYVASAFVFTSPWVPFYGVKRWLLRAFGASIGAGVILKPGVKVKYPWRLSIGRDTWIGEGAWIDNLERVSIGADCCISQGAYLCTGNHDWTDPSFRLMARPIEVGDQVWIGAKAIVGPGVVIGEGAVVSVGSVMTSNGVPWAIYSGNPAVLAKHRRLGDPDTRSEKSDELSG